MLSCIQLSKKPKMFKTFTGLSIEEFDRLYQIIESNYEKYEKKRLSREDRINARGQGRKFKLELIDHLIMFLVYYRQYPICTDRISIRPRSEQRIQEHRAS